MTTTATETFETYYWSGGHGGPHASLGDALTHAVEYLNGIGRRHDEVQIQLRGVNPITVLYVRKDEHRCNCGLCRCHGETFLHIQKF